MADPDQPSDDLLPPPLGMQYLIGSDGALLTGADGALLLGRRSEPEARASAAEALAEMQAAIAEIKQQSAQLGHNNPPEPIEPALVDAERAAADVQGQFDTPIPDKTILERAKATFDELSTKAKALITLAFGTAVDDGAKSIGHMMWAHHHRPAISVVCR